MLIERTVNASLAGIQVAQLLPECVNVLNFDCDDPVPRCRSSAGFAFGVLANITLMYLQRCPDGPWLFKSSGRIADSLTNQACEAIAGSGWTRYSIGEYAAIWDRLTTWKLPLFQLIANSPRPPLGWWVGAFSILHLLGDPIGSFRDLIYKLDSCQRRADEAASMVEDISSTDAVKGTPIDINRKSLQDSIALIIVSYDEWGSQVGDGARDLLSRRLTSLCANVDDGDGTQEFIKLCMECAMSLAADRSTKFLPVVVAQGLFIGSIVIAIVRTKSSAAGTNPSAFIDIETYSIGFSALYFWVIAVVTVVSIIGTSQTASSIPRILRKFDEAAFLNMQSIDYQSHDLSVAEAKCAPFHCDRYRTGGIYTWQPESMPRIRFWKTASIKFAAKWPWFCNCVPFLSISLAGITGMVVTSLVPPDGWSCRSIGELSILLTWIVSFPFTLIPWTNPRWRFWFTLSKDFLAMSVTLGLVIATQIGIFNKCSCYIGAFGLALPENTIVNSILQYRIGLHYPAITVAGIITQLVIIPGLVVARYSKAVRIFLQRDDGEGDLQWFRELSSEPKSKKSGPDPERSTAMREATKGGPVTSTKPLQHPPGSASDETALLILEGLEAGRQDAQLVRSVSARQKPTTLVSQPGPLRHDFV